jgi:hypothetical protein
MARRGAYAKGVAKREEILAAALEVLRKRDELDVAVLLRLLEPPTAPGPATAAARA